MNKLQYPRDLMHFIIIISALVIGLLYWYYKSDFWLNLLSEALGAAFTIFILDKLIHYEENRRTQPARLAAFYEAHFIYAQSCNLIRSIIDSSFNPIRDKHIFTRISNGIFDIEFMKIISNLNLENPAPIVPERTWRAHIYEQVLELERCIDRCIQRYSIFMNPELIIILQELERTTLIKFGKQLPTLQIVKQDNPYICHLCINEISLKHIYKLGIFLNKIRPQFSDCEKVPYIDLEHKQFIEDLRKR